jgi:hypothetical protein
LTYFILIFGDFMLKIPVKSTNNMRIDLDRIWVTLRQTLLSIAPEEATCKTRGFQVKNNLIAQRLEKIGYTFLDGIGTLFDMTGKPVWFVPLLEDAETNTNSLRDIK